MVFLAAANPYRLRKQSKNEGIIHPSRSTVLSHLVHPIPHNLLDFIWDYGSLPLETEKAYILGMVKSRPEFSPKQIVKLFVNSVSFGQQSVRTLEGGDSSSVSLRDLQRTIRFYGFFLDFLKKRKRPSSDVMPSEKEFSYWAYSKNPMKDEIEVKIRSVILTISICYLFRLCNKESRSTLVSECAKFIQSAFQSKRFSEEYVRQVIEDEEHDIIYRIRGKGLLPSDIAINCALKENIFTMLVCLLTRIPLIICGKPGSSKTQAFKILKDTLKGVSSEETLFSELPEINELYYQGTLHSTSHGIRRLFQRAQQNAKDNEFNNILTVFFFDEIGLAEISPNNPLKVLHDLLEEEDLQVAFLGISNWTLDASKMNRAVYLARWDLDREDLVEICLHYQKNQGKQCSSNKEIKSLVDSLPHKLADCYLKLREHQENHFKHKNFHGSRDFYSLVKFVFRHITSDMDMQQALNCLRQAFDRNFSGGFDQNGISSEVLIKKFFFEMLGFEEDILESKEFEVIKDSNRKMDFFKNSNIIDLILESLNDTTARFLLVFVDSNYVERILINAIQKTRAKVSFLQGSNFEYDLHNQSLSADLLKEFKFFLENGHTLIIKVKILFSPSLINIESRANSWSTLRLIQSKLHAGERQEILPNFFRITQGIGLYSSKFPANRASRSGFGVFRS